jgi:hypothetical protein
MMHCGNATAEPKLSYDSRYNANLVKDLRKTVNTSVTGTQTDAEDIPILGFKCRWRYFSRSAAPIMNDMAFSRVIPLWSP